MRLRQFKSKFWLVALVATCAKILLMFYPPEGDLINWAGVANAILTTILTGRYATALNTGVYGGLGLLLVPFLWIWFQLPISHPPVTWEYMLFGTSPSVLTLAFLLKVPTLLADIGTGILVMKIVGKETGRTSNGRVAFLLWYLNPFNVYWINLFGGMDIIPTFIFMLALKFALDEKWLRSGFGVAIGTITRIFPIFSLPFLLMIRSDRRRWKLSFLTAALAPLILGTIVLIAIGGSTLTSMAATPERQYWLLDFVGYDLTPNVKLTLVVLALQLYIVYRFWKDHTPISLATVSVLALLTAAQAYGGSTHHFLWVSPLLTTSVMLNSNERIPFALAFITACVAPSIFIPLPAYSDTLTWGAFWASKAIYLLRINLSNIKLPNPTQTISINEKAMQN